jgi:protease-4
MNPRFDPPSPEVIEANVAAALTEDIGPGDATASLLDDAADSAYLLCKEDCVVAGRPWFDACHRALDPGVGAIVQSVIDKGYRDFTGKVAQARGRSVEQVDEVARGRVWSGEQAKQRGLVDAFGGVEAAVADAAARAKLGKAETWQTRYIEESAKPFEQWFGGLIESRVGLGLLRASGVGEALLLQHLASQAGSPLRFVENALKNRGSVRVTPLAHCFCSAQ